LKITRRVPTIELCLLALVCLTVPGSLPAEDVAPAFPAAAPESTGLSKENLAQLADRVRGYLDEGQIVGAELLVIKNRRTVLHEVFGWRDREAEIAMTPNTIFNIRSMTKPLTGAAVQILIDEEKLSLADPVARYIPGFKNEKSKEITIEQLLTHRGGLPVTILAAVDQFDSLQSMADAVGERGPQFEPGSKFWYSDPGTDVLGAIVARVSGIPLEKFWERHLFRPLGMTDSFVALDKENPRWDRLANVYIGKPGEWFRFWGPSDEPLYPFAWGSQTVYSTPMDYARFLAMWMDDGMSGDARLLSPAAISRTLSPVSEASGMGTDAHVPTGFPGLSTFYGQLAVLWVDDESSEGAGPIVIGHSGSDGTFAWAWPDEDLMVLYFTQSRGGISGLNLERWIDELLIHPGEANGAQQAGSTAALYGEIVGEYLADYGSVRDTTIKLFLSSGRPALDLGMGRVMELRDPDDEGRWYFAISDKTSVSFDRDEKGTIVAMRMHEGGWVFEAPRKDARYTPEIDEAELQKYLGTYRVEKMDASITVLIHNHRLTLDKSSLPAKLPTDLFELNPPGEDGRWGYRIQKRLSVAFDEADDGSISGLRVFEGGNPALIGVRTAEDTRPLPGIDEVMALRNTAENTKILAGIGGVLKKGKVTLAQAGMTGEMTESSLGTDRFRLEVTLPQGSIVEVVNAQGAVSRQFAQEFVHEGKYLEQARNGHPLLLFLDWRESNDSVEVMGREVVQGREVYLVRTTDGGTSPVTYYVDAANGDLLKTKTVYLAVTGDVSSQTSFEDYRVVGGLRFPHRTTVTTQMGGDVIVEVEEILVGQEFPAKLFELAY
jgi:CubicO group peptidase (beta-lactamase class C family)